MYSFCKIPKKPPTKRTSRSFERLTLGVREKSEEESKESGKILRTEDYIIWSEYVPEDDACESLKILHIAPSALQDLEASLAEEDRLDY